MEYIPDTGTAITAILAVGVGYWFGLRIALSQKLSSYVMVIIQVLLSGILYYVFHSVFSYLYRTVSGKVPHNTPPKTSVTPNIQMFSDSPQVIPTTTSPSFPPIHPESGGTTASQHFGTSFLMSINTSIANPAPETPEQMDYAPLVYYRTVVPGSKTLGDTVLTLGYMPEGNLLQAIFYEPPFGTSPDIPQGDANETRITLGTPPIQKKFSVFLRTSPASVGYVNVEVYMNGVLGKTATVRSSFFGGAAGGVIPLIGYNAGPRSFPVVDAEIQSLMVWGNASSLSTRDIQTLADQPMGSEFMSLQNDTSACRNNQS